MTLKTKLKCCAILALAGTLFTGHALAKEEKFQATVFLIGVQRPSLIQDFTINGQRYYDAVRQGKQVKLPFRELREIAFVNPGNNFETEILFNDGRKELYSLRPAADIILDDGAIEITMSHIKIARIQFSPLTAQPASDNAPTRKQPQPGAVPATSDRVVLRNGDSLSGQIQTKTFPLRTAYGTFQLEAPKIASIEFDATKPGMAVVLLKNGDRLSGTVEAPSVRMTMTSGETVSFDGKRIQKIDFKR